jgi:peroxiredoxin
MRTALWLLLLSPAISFSGEFNKTLSLGDAAPSWKALPGTDGKKHSLADIKTDYAIVVFTCNSCPVAEEYEDRIIALSKKYEGKATVVAINVNLIPDDNLEAMKKRATKKKFSFAYLFDASQQIAKDYGANYTPEFFVLDKARHVVYMGALDDKTKAADVKEKYLEGALDKLLQGEKPIKGETIARGCQIRFKRTRD